MLGIHQAGTIIPQHGTGSAGASTQQQKIISFTADATNTPNPVNSRQYNKLAAASVVTPMSVATRDAPASVGRKATQYQATRRQRGGNAAATRRQRGGNAAATRRQRGGNAAAGDKPPSLKIRSQKIRSRKIRSRENPITGKSDPGMPATGDSHPAARINRAAALHFLKHFRSAHWRSTRRRRRVRWSR
jgi:hypothetical protein